MRITRLHCWKESHTRTYTSQHTQYIQLVQQSWMSIIQTDKRNDISQRRTTNNATLNSLCCCQLVTARHRRCHNDHMHTYNAHISESTQQEQQREHNKHSDLSMNQSTTMQQLTTKHKHKSRVRMSDTKVNNKHHTPALLLLRQLLLLLPPISQLVSLAD